MKSRKHLITLLAISVIAMQLWGCGDTSNDDASDSQSGQPNNDGAAVPVGPSDDHEATARAIVAARTSEDARDAIAFERPIQIARMAESLGGVYRHLTSNGKDAFVKSAEMVSEDKAAAFDKIMALLDKYKVNEHGHLPKDTDNLKFIQELTAITGGIEKRPLAGAKLVELKLDESTTRGSSIAYDMKLDVSGSVKQYRMVLKNEDGLWYNSSFKEDKRRPQVEPDSEDSSGDAAEDLDVLTE